MTMKKMTYKTAAISLFASILLIVCASGSLYAKAHPTKVNCRVETDRTILPAGGPQNVILKVTLDAPPAPSHIQRPMVNLALVLDRSGSMSGPKIEQAKAAAIEALSRLGIDDVFSVVVYDTNIHTIIPAQKARDLMWSNNRIRQIYPGGSTALFGGVSQGASEVRKNLENEFVHRIVLLSDGIANVGPRTPEELGRLGAALVKENISVTTIGVGTDYNEDLMARLSQKSDGNTYFVESEYDLPRIFSAELGDVLNVVAKKVTITIALPDNVEPVSIIGREGRIKKNRVEISMNQLYGDQEKYALIEVKVPKSVSGDRYEIAKAFVDYKNPFTQKREQSSGSSVAPFSHDKKAVEKSTNVGVVREYQLNLNALAQEKAIELSDQGKQKEAAGILKKSAAKLFGYGSKYKDPAVLEEAKELEVQAEAIEDKGLSKKGRKVLRTKSYQMKNQQPSQQEKNWHFFGNEK